MEFALVVPLLFLLVFGIIDFSRAYNTRISLTEAAAEGARAISLGRTDAQAATAARAALVGSTAPAASVRVVVTARCTAATGGATGSVRVIASFQLLTPIPATTRRFDLQGVGARQCAT